MITYVTVGCYVKLSMPHIKIQVKSEFEKKNTWNNNSPCVNTYTTKDRAIAWKFVNRIVKPPYIGFSIAVGLSLSLELFHHKHLIIESNKTKKLIL